MPLPLDEVIRTDEIPGPRQGEAWVVTPGYAVEFNRGQGAPAPLFFTALEPAVAHGLSGRHSHGGWTVWHVCRAAYELRWDAQLGRDVHRMYLGPDLEREEHLDGATLQRWASGATRAPSSTWPAP